MGRSDSAPQFVQTWQGRNTKYVSAAAKYMEMRLAEVTASAGEEARNALLQGMMARSQAAANNVLQSWFKSAPKEAVCKRALEMVDSGAYDVSPAVPVFSDLEALVEWAQ